MYRGGGESRRPATKCQARRSRRRRPGKTPRIPRRRPLEAQQTYGFSAAPTTPGNQALGLSHGSERDRAFILPHILGTLDGAASKALAEAGGCPDRPAVALVGVLEEGSASKYTNLTG